MKDHDPEGVEHIAEEFKRALDEGWDAIVPSALNPEAQWRRNDIYVPLHQAQKRSHEAVQPSDWQKRYEGEYAILDRVWKALGISSYEGADGKAIDQHVAEAMRDAARYRWLRNAKRAPYGSLVDLWLFSRPTASAVGIDAAIDAAMSSQSAPEGKEDG